MTDTPSRLFGLLLVMVAIWVGVYWLWEPAGRTVTADPRPPAAGGLLSQRPVVPPPSPNAEQPRTDLVPLPIQPPVVEIVPEPVAPPEPKTQTRKIAKVIKPEFRTYTV
ncbi:MAG: hypothetical protein K2Q20_06435, partial [Phycisphaerales bacterium]|nr:hypothetical protein [Phycisphaerales bacterium]